MNRRFLALFLTIALLITFLPVNGLAVDEQSCDVYNDVLTEQPAVIVDQNDVIGYAIDTPNTLLAVSGEYISKNDAVAALRQAMVQRQSEITLYYVSTNGNGKEEAQDLLNQAMVHTGNPVEGDYLRWHRSTIRYSYYPEGSYVDGVYHHMALFKLTYYTTAQQEAELTTAVNTLLASLDLDGKTDYQKFSAIYDYICANITYDYTNLNNDSYKLKYTAYAALINKTSVCQGYANLLYRLMLEVGIDCRLISGTGNGGGHGWNIVKMGDYYYNVDATWDAGSQPQYYDYCLVTDANFGDHQRGSDYSSAEFYAAYPMGTADYVDPGHIMTAYPATEATCTTNGNTAYWYCSRCDKYFDDANGDHEIEKDSWILPADGHDLHNMPANEGGCFLSGNVEYWICITCNHYFDDANGNHEIETGSWLTDSHGAQLVSYQAPTETEPGNIEHYYCSVCAKYYILQAGEYIEVLADDVVIPATGPQILLGDANGDGQVTAADASAIKAYRAGLTDSSRLDMDAADLDGNGKVDVYDAYLIQLFVAEMITKFPVEG